MRYKKIVSGLLACAMVVTSVFSGNVTTVKAGAIAESMPTAVGTYDFNATEVSPDVGTMAEGVKPIITGLTEYTGDVVYGTGRSGEAGDYAVRTGDYGLQLPETNLGSAYTVSMWIKTDNGFSSQGPALALGIGNATEHNWIAVAGKWLSSGTSTDCRMWAHGKTLNTSHTELTSNTSVSSGEWHMMTVTQSATTASFYVDGTLIGSGQADEVLNGEGTSICLGVNFWDAELVGLIDDVSVYDTALNGAQVRYLYDGNEDLRGIFDEKGFTATESMKLISGDTKQIKVTLPSEIPVENVDRITYKAEDGKEGVATVDDKGLVTAVGEGTVTITTTVRVGDVSKEATTTVTVRDKDKEVTPVGNYSFDGVLGNDVAVIGAANADSTETPVYVTGRTGKEGDQAVELAGKYALRLPNTDLGENYTVSVWVKPSSTIKSNGAVFLLGAAIPEEWMGFAGDNGTNTAKLWSVSAGMGYRHTTFSTVELPQDEWTMLTLSQDGSDLYVYKNGVQVHKQSGVGSMMKGDTQKILLGATYWGNDGIFNGCMDDVQVYDWTLTASEVYKLYDDTNEEDIFIEKGFEATEALELLEGATGTVKVTLPAGISEDNAEISFASDKTDIATVDAKTGVVTAVKEGTAKVTTTVKVGNTTKKAETTVTVDSEEGILNKEGITVSSEFIMKVGEEKTITVTLPEGVSKENVTISFESDKTGVATVGAETGVVTAVAAGKATITTTAKLGNTTKTATTNVTVITEDDIDSTLAVDYDFSKAVDGKLLDKSGHGNDATLHGTSNISFDDANGIMTMSGNDAWADLPLSIMGSLTDKEQFTIEVTFAKSAACGNNAWLYCFGSKVKSWGTNYMFLSPNFAGATLRAGIKNSSTEKLFGTSIKPVVDDWYTVNMVFDKGTVKLYWNGVLIKGDNGNELKTGYSIVDDVITPGTENGILGYIGKSCWSADDNYQGKISTFKIYNKAMTDEDVQLSRPEYQQAFQEEVNKGLTDASILGSNSSVSEVKYDLALPATFNEVDIAWESSNENVITTKGVVKNGETDQTVELTATITSGALTASKKFTVTVKALDKTELNKVLAEAQTASEDIYCSEKSRNELKKVMAKADTVTTQTEIDTLIRSIRSAISKLEYSELYKDPFTKIDESKLVSSKTLAPNATATVFAVPADIKDIVTVTYESSDPSVASVNASGVVTAKKIGYARITTTVTSKYDGFAMEYQTLIKVDLDLTKVTAKAKKTSLAKGGTTTIAVSYPTTVKNLKPVVTYRATGAVSVSKTGKITAKAAGTGKVYVKVKAAGKSITRTITVKVGEITGNSTVKVKKSITLKVTGLSGKVKWSVNNKKIANITSKGKLTGKKAGKVKVTAKVGNVTMTKTITVKKK